MTFDDLRPVVDRGAFYSLLRQTALSDTLDEHLGRYDWQADLERGELSFVSTAAPGRRVTASVELIATAALGPRSLLWGWAHPQSTGATAQQLRAYGQEHGIASLTTPELALPSGETAQAEVDSLIANVIHEIGMAMVGVTGRAPSYSAPAGGGTRVLFLLSGPDLSTRETRRTDVSLTLRP